MNHGSFLLSLVLEKDDHLQNIHKVTVTPFVQLSFQTLKEKRYFSKKS